MVCLAGDPGSPRSGRVREWVPVSGFKVPNVYALKTSGLFATRWNAEQYLLPDSSQAERNHLPF